MTDAAGGETPLVDVIVPTRNAWQLLERCLRCLQNQTLPPHSVIVVDNGSSDGTAERVAQTFPEVVLLHEKEPLGFPAACNRGVAAAGGDVVVLLNNDVEATPTLLEELARPLCDLRVGSVAALLVQPDRATIDSIGVSVDSTLAGFPRLRGAPLSQAESTEPVLAGPAGGAAAYRRAAWDDVGGLDEGVVGYGEDVDLALRLRRAGWTTAAAPRAIGVHLGSATFGRRSRFQRYQSGFARGYFLRRYRVLSSRSALRTLATETLVAGGDFLVSGDLQALRGRLAGWHAARELPPTPFPPADAVDKTMSFAQSLRRRVAVYRT